MPSFLDRLTAKRPEARGMDLDLLLQWNRLVVNGNTYFPTTTYAPDAKIETAAEDFSAYVNDIYKRDGVVYACMAFRSSVFSEARFQFQGLSAGRPGDLFGTSALNVLEVPWPNGTTGDLLARMVQDIDLAGNFYAVREGDELYRLRPDWVEIVLDRPAKEYDARPVGYLYWPGGKGLCRIEEAQVFTVAEVVHWAPKPDPIACYRGVSPLTPVLREIIGDMGMTTHKNKYLESGATPNLVVKVDPSTSFENFVKFKEQFQDDHEGAWNAYKTLFLAGGADVSVVGSDLKQLDFKQVQGAGETRIAAAFETPPVLVGLSEGLQAATYSNYASARRRFADGTLRPLWRSAAAALQSVVPAPGGSRLWFDDRDVAFLREDAKDNAEIRQMEAGTIRQLVDAGYEPETVTAAVLAGDYSKLKHSGLYSVQLQPPGTQSKPEQPALPAA